jgi:hypothetical protein
MRAWRNNRHEGSDAPRSIEPDFDPAVLVAAFGAGVAGDRGDAAIADDYK